MINSLKNFAELTKAPDCSEQSLLDSVRNNTSCGAWLSLIEDKTGNIIGLTFNAFSWDDRLIKYGPLIFPFKEEDYSSALNYLESQHRITYAGTQTEPPIPIVPKRRKKTPTIMSISFAPIAFCDTEPLHFCKSA
jgi:hypothetical protein